MNTHPQSDYYPSLDGLRAVSVLSVLLFHTDSAWLPGGFLGVESFFVLSGFIITTLLHSEWRRASRVDLKRFWQRRLRRLVPGVLTTWLGIWLAVLWLHPEELDQLSEDWLAGVSFTSNWFYILSERSYFEISGRPRLFEHLWSLGVEFQYYLVWPLLCPLWFAWGRRRAVAACVLGALASALWMAVLYDPLVDPSRVYFGTDTRSSGLLIGSALALLLPNWTAHAATRGWRWNLGALLGVAVLPALLALFWIVDERHPLLFPTGLNAVALLTAACIALSVMYPSSPLARFLMLPPLRTLGLRAYNIYLWHWPVFCLTQPGEDLPLDGIALSAVRFVIVALLSEISYRWIDTPIRQGALARSLQELRRAHGKQRRRLAGAWLGGSGAALAGLTALFSASHAAYQVEGNHQNVAAEQAALLGFGATAEASAPQESAPPVATHPSLLATALVQPASPPVGDCAETNDPWRNDAQLAPSELAWPETPPFELSAESTPLLLAVADEATATDALTAPALCEVRANADRQPPFRYTFKDNQAGAYVLRVQPAQDNRRTVYAIGDSVMLGAANQLFQRIGDIDVDAQVGRQFNAGIALLEERKHKHLLSDTVIVHLGHNAPINANQLIQLLNTLRDTPNVILVNLKIPRPYESANNRLLSQAISDYPNVTLLDWRSPSLAHIHEHLFTRDGIHLSAAGARLYSQLISAAVCPRVALGNDA